MLVQAMQRGFRWPFSPLIHGCYFASPCDLELLKGLSSLLPLPIPPVVGVLFFPHGFRLSLMRKKVAHLARSAMGGNDVPNPEESNVQLNWVRQQITVAMGGGRPNPYLANSLGTKHDGGQSPCPSGVNPDEILPRKTRKSSHCGRVASSYRRW